MPSDPVAALILDEAGPLSGRVLVVNDEDAHLTTAALAAGADVQAWCDDLREEEALPPRVAITDLDAARADTILLRLPRAISAVDDLAERLSPLLAPGGRLIAGGRIKHMTRAQNDALARHFGTVTASLGRRKSRVLHASDPRPGPRRWPTSRPLPTLGITAIAHGGVFATNRLDEGTGLLLDALAAHPTPVRGTALDVGCGSGIIATWLAQRGWDVHALDVSADAVASTRRTAAANGVTVEVRRADMLTTTATHTADLIVANPPFHIGGAKDSTPTLGMITDAARVLRPGGALWLVFNAHLPYLQHLRHHIGPTTIEARDRHYIVARAQRRPA